MSSSVPTATTTHNSNGKSRAGGRVVPHNLQAEESTLGAMLLSRDAIAAVGELGLVPDDFYKPAHGHVFAAVSSVYDRGEPVDPTTVADELRRDGLLDGIGGPATLVSLQAATPATTNAARYARIVADHALLRRLIGVAGDIADSAYDLPDDVDAALDEAEALVFGLGGNRGGGVEGLAVRDAVHQFLDRLEARFARGDDVTGIPTGLTELDGLLLGLHPAQLVTVAARPSVGKTSLAVNVSANVAGAGRPVAFFSIEMSQEELTERLVVLASQVDATRVRTGRLAQQDWNRINTSIGPVCEMPLWLFDDPNLTVASMRGRCRRLASKLGQPPLVIVDYLQLLQSTTKAENRQVEVAELSRGLKRLARELRAPVVATAQLSRNLEYRADKRPVLADLRESGQIEGDSDVVVFIYRDEVYHPDSADRGVAELIVAKQRNGPTGVARVAYQAQYGRWVNMARAI